MTEQNQKKTQQETHKPSADATSPFHVAFGMFRTEALRVADENEKAFERSVIEMKRAQSEGARLWESQVELMQSFTRVAFESTRRLWNV